MPRLPLSAYGTTAHERLIAELVAFIAFISASQIFGAVIGLTADDLQVTAGAT